MAIVERPGPCATIAHALHPQFMKLGLASRIHSRLIRIRCLHAVARLQQLGARITGLAQRGSCWIFQSAWRPRSPSRPLRGPADIRDANGQVRQERTWTCAACPQGEGHGWPESIEPTTRGSSVPGRWMEHKLHQQVSWGARCTRCPTMQRCARLIPARVPQRSCGGSPRNQAAGSGSRAISPRRGTRPRHCQRTSRTDTAGARIGHRKLIHPLVPSRASARLLG